MENLNSPSKTIIMYLIYYFEALQYYIARQKLVSLGNDTSTVENIRFFVMQSTT